VSNNTKNDLVAYCGCQPEKITVIYNGVESEFGFFSKEDQKKCRDELGLPQDETRLLLITGAEFYKNQETSLRVFEQLQTTCSCPVTLIRLGRNSRKWNSGVQASPYRDRVLHFEYLSRKDMVRLYNAVDCLLFPSWYEGFGWPPVEAMACGTPVVVSDRASLPEAVGDAGIIYAPDDVTSIAAALVRLFEDSQHRAQQIAKGLQHIKKFSWQQHAADTVKIYKQLAGNR